MTTLDTMDRQYRFREGMTVYGADGGKVGKVVAVDPAYVVVEKGFFFPSDYYIPTSAIASATDDDVYLTVTKDEALHQGWDALPATYATGTTDAETDTGYAAASGEAVRVPVYEEEITPVKRQVDRGKVRIEKDVVTEERTVTVPVTEERVRVSRVASDAPVPAGAIDAMEDRVIEVPVRGEEVELQKTARKKGEVVVEKEAVARDERIGGQVRREEVRVEDKTLRGAEVVDEEGRAMPR